MRFALTICTVLFVLGAAWAAAKADVTVSILSGTGSLTVDRLAEVGDEWEVEITVWGDGSDPVLIGVEGEDGDVIRYVHVVSIEKNPGDHAHLVVWAPDSQEHLERVREVKRVPNTGPDPDAWLHIRRVEAEHVGDESNSPGGFVEARIIDLVQASGDITATITTEGEFTDILEVIAGGDILGDVFTEQKVIGASGRSASSRPGARSGPLRTRS